MARIKTIEICVLLPSTSSKIEDGKFIELVVHLCEARSLFEIAWWNSVSRLTRYYYKKYNTLTVSIDKFNCVKPKKCIYMHLSEGLR